MDSKIIISTAIPLLIVIIVFWIFSVRYTRKGPPFVHDINDRFGKQNDEIISLLKDIKNSLENRKP